MTLALLPAAIAPARAAETAGSVEPRFRPRPSPDGQPRVALTLDACPGGFDQRIAQVLADQMIKATIFLCGTWIRRNPDGLGFFKAHRDLFVLENHGARHVPAITGTGRVYGLEVAGTLDNIRREIADGAAAIKDAAGTDPAWYRGAAARYTPDAISLVKDMGFRVAAFSMSADQGASLPALSVAHRMTKAQDGDVILGHVNQPHRPSGEGLAQGIIALRAAGFSFVFLNELNPEPV